jgi:pilus assembly protein FimV
LLGRISEALLAFDREKTLQVAQKYIEKRKYDRAISEYQKVVEHEPNDARTLLRIGDLQSRLGAHAEAIATYDRVAQYYAGRGFSLKAVAVLKQISELIDRHAPQLADQYGHVAPRLAQIYAELGLMNDALATYDAVARRLQNRGRDRDAVEIIRRMVSLERSNPLPYLRLAEALCRVSRIDEAVEHFWSAAQLLTQQGRPDDALKVLERILHFRQDVRVARVAAELYLAKNDRDSGLSALSRLQLCFEADPRDLETLGLLARAFDVIGQPAKGVEVYKEMVRIAGETGQHELHQRCVQHLLRVAPRDDQVRALAAVYGVKAAERAAPVAGSHSSIPPESLTEEDLEFIDDQPAEDSAPPPVAARPAVPVPASAKRPSPTGKSPIGKSSTGKNPSGKSSPGAVSPAAVSPAAVSPAAVSPAAIAPAALAATAAAAMGPLAVVDGTRKALVDAEAFRALKMYQKAASTLRKALGPAPDSLELRAALQQVLLDMGDRDGAIDQMLSVAQHYVDRGSLPAAEAELYQVLELSPDHPAATALLEQIEDLTRDRRRAGRSSPKAASAGELDQTSSPGGTTGEHEAFELVAARISTPPLVEDDLQDAELEGDERLPAYELDDEDLITVMPGSMAVSPERDDAPATPERAAAAFDRGAASPGPERAPAPDARAEPAGRAVPDAPLPQFSLDSGLHVAPEAPAGARADGARGVTARGAELRSEPVASQAPPSRRESIRAALDEAQFFSSRGLYQDASLILLDRLEQYPGDTELAAALEELQPKLESESGTRDVGSLGGSVARGGSSFDDEEKTALSPPPEAFEPAPARSAAGSASLATPHLGKELVVQFSTEGATRPGPIIDADADLDLVQALEQPKQQQIDVDEVFAKFKQGVKAQVSDNDSATHYDLGVAYKEMGLLADAAREFELASRDPKRECNCLAMMGMMYRERGELDRAAEAYVRGLSAQHKTVAQEVSLYYDLGIVYEMKNDPDEAVYYFQRITRRDPTYRDVSQRLAALLPRSRRFSQPARAINDDQEFDRTFDDLYKRD